MKRSRWRVVAAACIVAAGLSFVVGLFVVGLTAKNASQRDFIQYWAAGQQLIHHANPYDFDAILQLERTVGLEGNVPKISFSPPVAFFLVLPLGLVGAKTGLILWLLVQLGCLILSVRILWIVDGRPASGLHFTGIAFAPALACLMAGQLGIFFLLGISIFLLLHESHPFISGAVLLPCSLKPHLFLPCAIVLVLWAIHRRAFRIPAGFSIALLASCALTLSFDRHVWTEYFQMMPLAGISSVFVPTLSVALRFLLDRNAIWLQYIPELLACAWALWYFQSRRDHWKWSDHGLLVLLVSAVCTPYGFFFDEVVLFPAVLAALYRAEESGRPLLPFALIAGGALCELLMGPGMTTPYYLWTTPAWLGWYLYATRSKRVSAQEADHPAAQTN
jgi:hypothetical protein